MAAPFFNAIKGTTSGTPGTGAFTPNAAPAGFIAWSTVFSGWVDLVRYEDGSAWELSYGYWNGTTITRPATGFVSSSTGTQLSLTSAATAAMVVGAAETQPHIGGCRWSLWSAIANSTTFSAIGIGAPTVTGTATGVAIGSSTTFFTEQVREQAASATTANAQCGYSGAQPICVYHTTAGRGGGEITVRWGVAQLPTGPRLFMGANSSAGSYIGSTAEPSAFAGHFAVFGKDSTDTNIQFMTNNGGTAGKTDTGIPITAATGWYESSIWWPPGGGTIYGLLVRLDDPSGSNIWYGSRTTSLPTSPARMVPELIGGLSATTGTAFQLHLGSMATRQGGG